MPWASTVQLCNTIAAVDKAAHAAGMARSEFLRYRVFGRDSARKPLPLKQEATPALPAWGSTLFLKPTVTGKGGRRRTGGCMATLNAPRGGSQHAAGRRADPQALPPRGRHMPTPKRAAVARPPPPIQVRHGAGTSGRRTKQEAVRPTFRRGF